jgi:hypothetical protein
MISEAEARELIVDLFEEEALVIGGLVAVHEVDDDMVWRLVRNLDVICGKILRRLDAKNQPDVDGPLTRGEPKLQPHPAIENFLQKLRKA